MKEKMRQMIAFICLNIYQSLHKQIITSSQLNGRIITTLVPVGCEAGDREVIIVMQQHGETFFCSLLNNIKVIHCRTLFDKNTDVLKSRPAHCQYKGVA